MSALLGYVVGSLVLFVGYYILLLHEQRRQQRMFLASGRGQLDRVCMRLLEWQRFVVRYIHQYILRLAWHHSLQTLFRKILRILERTYVYLEAKMHHSRRQARTLRRERLSSNEMSHLAQIQAHKQDTALSPEEQQRIRQDRLERG